MGEVMLKGFICERCHHKWVPREDEIPKVCPKCKSPYWNIQRKSNINKPGLSLNDKKRLK
jgi:Zn finger protein HypA/HybF involved in hydrogenase expression